MKKQSRLWKLLWLVAFFPLAFLLFDNQAAEWIETQKDIEEKRKFINLQLLTISQSLNPEIIITKMIRDFSIVAFEYIKNNGYKNLEEYLSKLHKEKLENQLPPHDLFLATRDIFREKFTTRFLYSHNMGLSSPEIEYFGETNQVWRPVEERVAKLQKWFEQALQFPYLNFLTVPGYRGKIQKFLSYKGQRMFYFDFFPFEASDFKEIQGMIGLCVDWSKLSQEFAPRVLIDSWKENDLGLAFVPLGNDKALLSTAFRQNAVWDKIIEYIKISPPALLEVKVWRNTIFGISPPPVGSPYYTLITYPLKARKASKKTDFTLVVLAVFYLAIVLYLFVQREIFNRWPKLGYVLTTSFILAVFFPTSIILGLFRKTLTDKIIQEKREYAESLDSHLKNLDQVYRSFQAQIVQDFRNFSNNPARAIEFKSQQEKDSGDLSLRDLFKQWIKQFPLLSHFIYNGIVLVVGENGFSRILNRRLYLENTDIKLIKENLLELLLPLSNIAFERLQEKQGLIKNSSIESKVSKFEVAGEEARKVSAKFGGVEMTLGITEHIDEILEIDPGMGKVIIARFPIFLGRKLSFLLTWIINLDCFELPFKKHEIIAQSQNLRGGKLFASSAIHEKTESFPPGLSEIPELYQLVEKVRKSNLILKNEYVDASQSVLLQALPSKNLFQTIFSGVLPIKDSSEEMKHKLRQYILIGLLLAFTAAAGATLFFMLPFRRILKAMERVKAGDINVHLADDARTDEFGTLAASFNAMIKALREKEILGRYVSSAVKKAISDTSFKESIKEGQNRDVTILFSGLIAFEEFRKNNPPEDVFKIMETHLTIVNQAIAKFGGEIDKVIGEKILIVFDHKEFGDGENATEAALKTAWYIIKNIPARNSLPPAIGISSGPAIAGILGSPNVRLDYTVIGDTVNLGARLATLAQITTGTRLVISSDVYARKKEIILAERLPFKRVKGKIKEVEAYLVKNLLVNIS